MTEDRRKELVHWLPLAEWWYNTSYHSSIRTTPYEVVYRQPPVHIPYEALGSSLDVVDRSLQHREATVRMLKEHLHNAQHRIKVQVARKEVRGNLLQGTWCLLSCVPINKRLSNHSLCQGSLGPLKFCSGLEWWLTDWNCRKGHEFTPVIPVSQLKKKTGSYSCTSYLPTTLTTHNTWTCYTGAGSYT
ncbi:UNVERIFIED_CONTAM: hypothetical protein Sangu_1709300 [Sesamum angustifolium]|uniref:Uncharacterized protein n=1 Tax=Sesamum angustifolium TaxID=2727405 RepID=A0AAW2ML13_9LAMI